MKGQDKFDQFIAKHPHGHLPISQKPHWTRRRFFELAGAGVTGMFLADRARASEADRAATVTTINKAKNVVFILLNGAPSHTDTFDLKVVDGVTPAAVNPTMINGINWPVGILPKTGQKLSDIAIVRSVQPWALVHSLAQVWQQIGRNPAAALGDIAPNIGSVVAIEKDPERKPTQVFPTFLALNSNAAVGSGYFPATYGPFKTAPSTRGLSNTTNVDGESRLDDRWSLLHGLDDPLRVNSPFGKDAQDMDAFYSSAKKLTYNPIVDQAFKFSAEDSLRYGNNGFGNACLVAKQVLQANQGTRFVQISVGGWDMHQDIYGVNNPKGTNIFTLGKVLDDGYSALLGDLKAAGMLNETLVVMSGEFGRTVGKLSAALGRDHYSQQFVAFAGAGVKGGRALGATDATGGASTSFGWSRDRNVRPEDVEATIYSALGINWTTIRYDDPFGRGFEYVPFAASDLYGPINELWS